MAELNGPDDLSKRPPPRRNYYSSSSGSSYYYGRGNVRVGNVSMPPVGNVPIGSLFFSPAAAPVLVVKPKTIDEMLEDCKDETLDDDAPDEKRCVVCTDRKRVVAPQCGHLVLCATCTKSLNPKKCPTCRAAITSVQRIFF